jgi:hypothetical protein
VHLEVREQLGAKARSGLLMAAGGWCVFVATVLMPSLPTWLMVGSFVATCGALLVLIIGLRCPHCRQGLAQVGILAALVPLQRSQQTCSGCGRSLD